MRAWTDGNRHWILDAAGLWVHDRDHASLLLAAGPPHGFDDEILLVSPSGERAFVWMLARAVLAIFDASGARVPFDTRLSPVGWIAERAMLGLGYDDDGELVLVARNPFDETGRPDAGELTWPEEVRVTWPESVLWREAPFADDVFPISKTWTCIDGPHGPCAADGGTGLVLGLSAAGAAEIALQVPVEHPEVPLRAVRTARGVAVVHGGGRMSGALTHFDANGACTGSQRLAGVVSEPRVLADGTLLVVREAADYTGGLELCRFSLPELAPIDVRRAPGSACNGYPCLACTADGSTVLVGDGGAWQQL